MITIETTAGKKKSFNLRDFGTEKKALAAWRAMRGDPKFAGKAFKFTTTDNEVIQYRIDEIVDCKFEESEYCKTVTVGDIKENRQKKEQAKKEQDAKPSFMDILDKAQKEKEEKNIKAFMQALARSGIIPDMQDPFLHRTLESVRRTEEWKIPLYVNLYKAGKGYK